MRRPPLARATWSFRGLTIFRLVGERWWLLDFASLTTAEALISSSVNFPVGLAARDGIKSRRTSTGCGVYRRLTSKNFVTCATADTLINCRVNELIVLNR